MIRPWWVLCLLGAACASSPSGTTPGGATTTTAAAVVKKPAEPTVSIARVDINSAQPSTATSVPLVIRVKVENRTEEPVTVDRIEVVSVGIGPYTIAATAQDFHHDVQAGHVSIFPVWVQGTPATSDANEAARRGVDETLGGQEGSLMMRASVLVTTPTRPQHLLRTVQKVDTTLSH